MSNTKARSPFATTAAQAITKLRATGNWPRRTTLSREDASTDYLVNAAFWNRPGRLNAYLR